MALHTKICIVLLSFLFCAPVAHAQPAKPPPVSVQQPAAPPPTAAPVAPAPAQPPAAPCKPSANDVKGAKAAHTFAESFNNKKQYREAIQQWELAYKLDCTAHRLLLNIGNAWEKIPGGTAKAIETYQLYLERIAPAKDPQIAESIENLKRLLGEQEKPPAPPPAPPPPPVAVVKVPPPKPVPLPPPAIVDDESGDGSSVGAIVLGGTGMAAAVAGAVLLGIGQGKVADAKAACPFTFSEGSFDGPAGDHNCGVDPDGVPRSSEETSSLIAKGEEGLLMRAAGIATLIPGVLVAAGGATWFAVTLPEDKESASSPTPLKLTPIATPGYAGVRMSGSF